MFFFVNKFDYSVKVQSQNPRKVYCIDNGFLVSLGFRISEDIRRLLENMVAIELKRRGEKIFYCSENGECDFLVRESNNVKELIQVAYEINKSNKERELKGLLEAMNRFSIKKGHIITLNQEEELKINGRVIIILPAWKWLLQQGLKL